MFRRRRGIAPVVVIGVVVASAAGFFAVQKAMADRLGPSSTANLDDGNPNPRDFMLGKPPAEGESAAVLRASDDPPPPATGLPRTAPRDDLGILQGVVDQAHGEFQAAMASGDRGRIRAATETLRTATDAYQRARASR